MKADGSIFGCFPWNLTIILRSFQAMIIADNITEGEFFRNKEKGDSKVYYGLPDSLRYRNLRSLFSLHEGNDSYLLR